MIRLLAVGCWFYGARG